MAKKVAYLVRKGRVPGVYNTYEEVQKQCNGYPGNEQKGYTAAQGGRRQAEADFQHCLASNRPAQDAPTRNQYSLSRDGFEFHGSASLVNTLPSKTYPAPAVLSSGKRRCDSTEYEDSMWKRINPLNQRHRREFCAEQCAPALAMGTSRSNSSACTPSPNGATPVNHSTTPLGSYSAPDYISLASSADEEDEAEPNGVLSDQYFANASTASGTTEPTEPPLCDEQTSLVQIIVDGHNTFYTGSAGCGKSTVLKAFVKELRTKGKKVHIVAPTGRAALDIGGTTIWTYAGWAPESMRIPLSTSWKPSHKPSSHETLCHRAHKRSTWKRLRSTDVLVIDEISMVENLLFERLNHIMKEARDSELAFGGAQVVVTGDFCQLPPVKPFEYCLCGERLKGTPNTNPTTYQCNAHGTFQDAAKWAFKSDAWEECNFKHVNLTKIHRQSDGEFKRILNCCRLGDSLSKDDRQLLLEHKCNTKNAVELFPTRSEVQAVNDREFRLLDSPEYKFDSHDYLQWDEEHAELKSRAQRGYVFAEGEHRLETEIKVKKNMQVVLLVNLDLSRGLVNGSQGVIIDFVQHADRRLPEQSGDHKDYKMNQVSDFISKNRKQQIWPVVRFTNGVEETIFAHCTVSEYGDREHCSLLSRTQIPLVAAWAMTIHKCQGMTLFSVVVDLSKSFETGQEYVALSRAKSLNGLRVKALGSLKRGPDREVRKFLDEKFGVSQMDASLDCAFGSRMPTNLEAITQNG